MLPLNVLSLASIKWGYCYLLNLYCYNRYTKEGRKFQASQIILINTSTMKKWKVQWERSEWTYFLNLQPPTQTSAAEVWTEGQDLTSQGTTALPTLLREAAWLKPIYSGLKTQSDRLWNMDSQNEVQNEAV